MLNARLATRMNYVRIAGELEIFAGEIFDSVLGVLRP
jgi:hypothetical protein